MIRLFRHYVPGSLIWLGAGEILVLVLCAYAALSLVLVQQQVNGIQPVATAAWVSGFTLIMLLSLFAAGLYQLRLIDDLRRTMLRLAAGVTAGGLITSMVFYLLPLKWLAPNVVGICLATSIVGLIATRLFFYCFLTSKPLRRKVLVIGTGESARRLTDTIEQTWRANVELVGFVPVTNDKTRQVDEKRLVVPTAELHSLADELAVDEIVIALDDRRGVLPAEQILDCKMRGTPVTDLFEFVEKQTGTVNLESLNPSNLIFCDGFTRAAIGDWRKRSFDIVISILLLVAALPVMLITAITIWLESGARGPVLYRQTRVGKHNQPFQVLKFRSMIVNAEHQGAQWAQTNDCRVTRVGKFIRKTRIDELPQLVNVFRGEMSFVGPRPERPGFVAELSAEIPFYHLRHNTLPGITGWAQVCYPYGASTDDARRKLQFDLYYMKNRSLFLDLTILFQTVQVCLWGQGAR